MADVTQSTIQQRSKEDVLADQATIKAKMPKTYAYITETVKRVGPEAFKNVNRGLYGEPNRFFAFENGISMGTVFTEAGVLQEIITQMMRHGAQYFCVLLEPAKMEAN